MHKSPVMNKLTIDRRTCLKGVGTALALPLLDVMGWAEAAEKQAFAPPVRLGFMYMPHGVIMDEFWPADAESFLTSPPPALESLRPVLDQCLMMKGIAGVSNGPFKNAPHALGTLDLAHRGLARSGQARPDQYLYFGRPNCRERTGSIHDTPVFRTRDHASNLERESSWFERGLLFALQFPFSDSSGPSRDQSAQRAEPTVRRRTAKWVSGDVSGESVGPQHARPSPGRGTRLTAHPAADRPAKVGRIPGQRAFCGTTYRGD